MIQAIGLEKVFDAGKPFEVRAVDGVNLTIHKGEVILIMGPSGSGKTTLITLLGGLAHPTQGSLAVAGQELAKLAGEKLTRFRRNNIGFVFQSFHLLQSLTALKNVEIIFRLAGVNRFDSNRRAQELLEKLGLKQRLRAYPRELSGGEKQRVSVARALANNPSIIFADEPTANLDSKTGHEVMRLLCGIACEEHRTVVIVSHDQRLRDMAMWIFWMEDGRITREGKGGHDNWCQMPHNF